MAPSLGGFGSTGDKLILWSGTASVHPFSLGIKNAILWYPSPANTSHIFYVGGSPISTINSSVLSITGILYTAGNSRIGNNNDLGSLVVGNIDADGSDGSIVISKRQNANVKRNFKIGIDGAYNLCFGDFGFC
jgi:hypothetical protein